MKVLKSHILTTNESQFKGHYIIQIKRSGDWCLYKHRDYNGGPVLGYYVFRALNDGEQEILPLQFYYYKSRTSAVKTYKKMIGSQEIKEPEALPDTWRVGSVRYEVIKRLGCAVAYKAINELTNRCIGYYYSEIKVNSGNKETVNASAKKYSSKPYVLRQISMLNTENLDEAAEIERMRETIKATNEHIKRLKKEIAYIRSGKPFSIVLLDK